MMVGRLLFGKKNGLFSGDMLILGREYHSNRTFVLTSKDQALTLVKIHTWDYISVDPKQFTVSKFRLKPVILISECFCSTWGPHQPTPTPHMKGDNRRQWETRPLQSPRRRPHQPTPTPHMKGDNRRQRETRPLQSPRSRPHQPTPRRPDLKLH